MKNKIYFFLISILLFIILFLSGFKIIIFDESLYKEQFGKYNVYSNFNSEDEANENLKLLINYLKDKNPKLETDFFNEKEKIHLNDVKNIIKKLIILLYFSIILIILIFSYFIYKGKYKFILKSLILGLSLTIFIIILFYILVLFDFDKVFTYFHLVSFDNNYWLLNPETDNLIKMFPQEIFFDLARIAILYSLISSLIILVFSIFLLYKTRK